MKKLKKFSDYVKNIKKSNKINSGRSFNLEGEDMSKLAVSLIDFMEKEGGISLWDNLPKIVFTRAKQESNGTPIFRETGYYNPEWGEICIFTKDRALKDCLRSLAHELIHADQRINLKMDTEKASNGIYKKSKEAEEIEADAYERGNVLFRKWEEYLRKNKS